MEIGFTYARDCEKRAAYEEGYQDAIDKACEWLNNNFYLFPNAVRIDDVLDVFRKAMEE